MKKILMISAEDQLAPHRAIIMITCETGGEETAIERLRTIKGVTESVRTNGSYDIMTSLEVPTTEDLRNTIEFKIRRIPNVRSTTTLIKS